MIKRYNDRPAADFHFSFNFDSDEYFQARAMQKNMILRSLVRSMSVRFELQTAATACSMKTGAS